MLMMGKVSLVHVDSPTVDGAILNRWQIWKQFQAATRNNTSLGDFDKLTYLRDAMNGRCFRYVIQWLTQIDRS